jgi:hypothetical protein
MERVETCLEADQAEEMIELIHAGESSNSAEMAPSCLHERSRECESSTAKDAGAEPTATCSSQTHSLFCRRRASP